jgi:hypothetical protein
MSDMLPVTTIEDRAPVTLVIFVESDDHAASTLWTFSGLSNIPAAGFLA